MFMAYHSCWWAIIKRVWYCKVVFRFLLLKNNVDINMNGRALTSKYPLLHNSDKNTCKNNSHYQHCLTSGNQLRFEIIQASFIQQNLSKKREVHGILNCPFPPPYIHAALKANSSKSWWNRQPGNCWLRLKLLQSPSLRELASWGFLGDSLKLFPGVICERQISSNSITSWLPEIVVNSEAKIRQTKKLEGNTGDWDVCGRLWKALTYSRNDLRSS